MKKKVYKKITAKQTQLLHNYFDPQNSDGKFHEGRRILKYIKKNKLKITDERTLAYDSPTGRAFIGVSKRPLQTIKNGYGYSGVLLQTDNREFIQCHVCGLWFRALRLQHLRKHDLTTESYRKKFSLTPSQALVSDGLSYMLEKGRANLAKWIKANPEKTMAARKLAQANYRKKRGLKRITNDAHNNRYAMCEKQLGFRLLEYIKKYKELPNSRKGEGDSIQKALRNRYGSTNQGFKHYEVPTRHREGMKVELIAPNNKQLFFNYKNNYNKDKIYTWIMENTPRLSEPNMFVD